MRVLLVPLAVLALAAGTAHADQKDTRLDALFAQLKATSDADEARQAEQRVWQIWIEQEDDDARLLFNRGLVYMSFEQYDQAVAAFTDVVQRLPDFAEAWNKRATVYFLMEKYDESVADIEKTLALEPRHFGALSGLGQIYLALGKKAAAVKAFEAALAIDPNLPGERELVEKLKKELEGKPT
jgi:tetratricopeptide (TPR) repeat protein